MDKHGIEVIPSFKIKYPEYTIITPHTNKEYTIRSLKIGEEESLRSSILTPASLTEHLNNAIFGCLVNKPDDVVTIEDFLNKSTIADREALMYGLYHITYKDKHAYDITCKECEHVNPVKVNFGDSFSMVAWNKETNILDEEVRVQLELAESVTVVLKQANLMEEQELMNMLKFSSDDEREKQIGLLSISCFEIDVGGTSVNGNDKDVIKDRNNIKQIYNDLPAQDRMSIEDSYEKNFGKYGVTIKVLMNCAKCHTSNETEIDLVRQFFRAIYG